jgi:hypothetical protein
MIIDFSEFVRQNDPIAKFPTCSMTDSKFNHWDVRPDTGDYVADRAFAEDLAARSIQAAQTFDEGYLVLAQVIIEASLAVAENKPTKQTAIGFIEHITLLISFHRAAPLPSCRKFD